MSKSKARKSQKQKQALYQERVAQQRELACEKEARNKRILTTVVCVILVLALGLPTTALAFLAA